LVQQQNQAGIRLPAFKTPPPHHEGHKVKFESNDKNQRFDFVVFVYFVVKEIFL
jgi:hypothetical protein